MARTALLNTDTEDLKELLGHGKSFGVPPYQRDYSWRQEDTIAKRQIALANVAKSQWALSIQG